MHRKQIFIIQNKSLTFLLIKSQLVKNIPDYYKKSIIAKQDSKLLLQVNYCKKTPNYFEPLVSVQKIHFMILLFSKNFCGDTKNS